MFLFPTLSGGIHHYGQLHMKSPSSFHQDFRTNPKLDYFRRDLVDGWLESNKTLPISFLDIKRYLNQAATTTLMGADCVQYVWILKPSLAKPSANYAIDLWAEGIYDLGESLALFMGFLEFDPIHPSRTCIVAYNDIWVDTGNNTRAPFVVRRLDTQHTGISDEDYQVGGVRIFLDIGADRL